jgi:hypothetical protein
MIALLIRVLVCVALGSFLAVGAAIGLMRG